MLLTSLSEFIPYAERVTDERHTHQRHAVVSFYHRAIDIVKTGGDPARLRL